MPIITMALTGDCPLDELYDYADNTLRNRLTVLSGVADVQLIGGAKREVHVALDREKLAARGLSSMDVVRTIREGVRLIPCGRVRQSGSEYAVKFDADYDRAADIGELEVANEEGQRSYIKDMARGRISAPPSWLPSACRSPSWSASSSCIRSASP